jgi:SAM-dependent methyltransferase
MLAAAAAFDAVADRFDERFTPWLSVARQRGAVRVELAAAFPRPARLIEIGGGTGEDALWLAARGHDVLFTDASPAMVRRAAAKLRGHVAEEPEVVAAEDLETLAARRADLGAPSFDGAFSNFAGLNCVADLRPVARGLASLVRPGGHVLLVLFGTFCPAEMAVEALRGRPRNMLRRLSAGDVPARLGGRSFTVRYHRASAIRRAMAPWFAPAGRCGIGVFVPPSAAEPWISRHPRLLRAVAAADRALSSPLAALGDHVLYRFVRGDAPADAA